MLFNSNIFIFAFLPIVLFVFYSVGSRGQYRIAISWLIVASLFFYGWWNPAYLSLILVSILFNYTMGDALLRRHPRGGINYLLWIGVTINLMPLGYFKYANFFVDNVNAIANTQYHLETIILPLAISFFTFQQIIFLVDASKGKSSEHSFLHYCLFVTFFPQLIAGPIVHHREMLPQIAQSSTYRFVKSNFSIGLTIFFLGLFKKAVLADGAALYATPVFDAAEEGMTLTFFEAWAGAIGYTFQLYFDFSGYSDMAIGIARMFNIDLPLNFHSPYKSRSIIEFWQRWHMTLSRFLRDYLYIPLGGNRKGEIRRYTNLFVTMILGGLWHGAGWTYVAWGALHGLYLIVNHAWRAACRKFNLSFNAAGLLGQAVAWSITMTAVVVSWVFFRAESFGGAIRVLEGMTGKNGFVLPAQVADAIPGLDKIVRTVGTMPLLGGGSIMGVIEMTGMFAIMSTLIFLPAMHEMKTSHRLIALAMSFYFTLQAVLFTHTSSEFLYFQF